MSIVALRPAPGPGTGSALLVDGGRYARGLLGAPMHWTARDDRTLALSDATPAARQAALSALEQLRDCGDDEAHDLGEHLIHGLRAGVIQATDLTRLGTLCHRHDHAREPSRFVAETLFDFVLPTPTAGLDQAYFWRVARRLETAAGPALARRQMRYRTFGRRPDACAHATELGDRLVSITESQNGDGPTTTTLWFWEDVRG